MPFSKVFAILILIGVIPTSLGLFIGGAFYFFIIYNALIVVFLLIDLIITPGQKSFEAERVCDEKFSLGADNEVFIRIRNNSRFSLRMECKDEVPSYFKLRDFIVKIQAIPHTECEGKYYVAPQKRGEYTFGHVYCRYAGVLRICMKSVKYDLTRNYKVYPNLRDLRKYSIAALNKSQMLYGVKKSKSYSLGTEFESLREYNEGDDYRKINWMATARSSKLIVNTYEPEKNQQIIIMLDSSRVMNSEINYIKKLDYAINSAFLLADVAIKKGDNTGLMVFDSDVKRYIKPGKGLSQFQLIADNLYNVEENFVTADYRNALRYLNEYHKRRSLLCIFTELFNADEAAQLVTALKSLARSHIPLVITIKDMRLIETANSKINETNDLFLKSAAMKLIEEREKIQKIFHNSGVPCLDVPPDMLSIEVVNKYLTMKSMLQI